MQAELIRLVDSVDPGSVEDWATLLALHDLIHRPYPFDDAGDRLLTALAAIIRRDQLIDSQAQTDHEEKVELFHCSAKATGFRRCRAVHRLRQPSWTAGGPGFAHCRFNGCDVSPAAMS